MRSRHILLILFIVVILLPLRYEGMEHSESSTVADYDIVYDNGLILNGSGPPLVWENVSVKIVGSVRNSGEIIIRNSTVDLYESSQGRFRITNRGKIRIDDTDDDPTTPNDSSFIRSMSGRQFDLNGEIGSMLEANNSLMIGIRLLNCSMNLTGMKMVNSTIVDPVPPWNIHDLAMHGNGTGTAMRFDNPANIRLAGIRVDGYLKGIVLENTAGRFENISISSCTQGIIGNGSGLTILRSSFAGIEIPILARSSVDIVGITVVGGRSEFDRTNTTNIHDSSFVSIVSLNNITGGAIRGNNFRNASKAVRSPFGVRLIENRFVGNGVAVKNARECELYHNSFIANLRIVEGPPLSTWYNATLGEGNYYDLYPGMDDGSGGRRALDGIGDTSIPFLGRDPYPLMQDEQWEMPQIPEIWHRYGSGSGTVEVDWEQKGSRFILQRSTSGDFSTRLDSWSTSNPYLVIDDNPNSTLYFRVRGFNSFGSRGWSLTDRVVVNQKPFPPHDLRVLPVPEGGSLEVRWKWEGEDIEKGLVYYSRGVQDYNPRVVEYPNESYILRGLENGVEYSLYMIAVDSSGLYSAPSSLANGTPVDTLPPPPPRNLWASPLGNTSVVLEWDPPLTQDLWGYIIFRRELPGGDLTEITRLSSEVIHFEDTGLSDNTTYEYYLASVDDDGPVSPLTSPVSVTTTHYNQKPVYRGKDTILYLVEDEGPLSSHLLDDFFDPDGDELHFSITDYFPFKAGISDGLLWIVPDKDQAGEGYVQISVSDGEAAVPYLIGVVVKQVEDAPRDVKILFPVNGTVLLPGVPARLEASGYDPDVPYGDSLNVTWTSDRDGVLFHSIHSVLGTVQELTPGVHVLELRITDRAGNSAMDSVKVIVSLWGWGEVPWNAVFNEPLVIDPGSPYVELKLMNDSPFILRFDITGRTSSDMDLMERNILVGPRSDGQITIELPAGSLQGREINMGVHVETMTLNGTYGGSLDLNRTFPLKEASSSRGSEGSLMMVIIISFIAVIGIGVYFLHTARARNRKGD